MLDALTLDQLRILACVAETGSFSAAARKLGRVQSAISQSIKSTEDTLRLELFERSGRMPKITPAGAALLRDATSILNDIEALKRRAESMASGYAPQLTLAVDQVFPNHLLIKSLQAFSRAFPLTPVTLYTEGLGATEQRLRTNVARLAIYSPLTMDAPDLEMQFLASVRIVPVVASSHPLSRKEGPLGPLEIRRHVQLVLTDRAQATSGMILSSRYWMFADQYSRLEYLLQGIGWSFAPFHLVRERVAAGQIKLLDFEIFQGRPLSLPLYTVHLRGLQLDRGTVWLIDYLRRRLLEQRHYFLGPEEEENAILYPLAPVATI